MNSELPPWRPLDPDSAGDAPLSLPSSDGPGRIVAVLTTPGAADGGWSADTVVELARGWTRRSERVLLADLNLAHPSLHEALDVVNGEGVSDVVLWGASFQRVAHVVEAGLLFASSGTVVADPTPVLTSDRWSAITDGFKRANATLIAYLPMGVVGRRELLDRVSDIIVLARQEEAPHIDLGDLSDRVRAVFGPGRVTAGAAVGAGHDLGRDDPLSEDAFEVAPAAAEKSRRGVPVSVLLAAAVVALFLVAWSGVVEIPGLSPLLRGSPEAVATPATPPPSSEASEELVSEDPGQAEPAQAEQPEPEDPAPAPAASESTTEPTDVTGPLQAWALQMAAYPEFQSAVDLGEDVVGQVPGSWYVVAPVLVNGTVYHRVLAASAENEAQIEEMRTALRTSLGYSPAQAGGWIARQASYAYFLADVPALAQARQRVTDYVSRGIPAYLLQVSLDGRTAYRIYAGAFATPAEASYLGTVLAEEGLASAPLLRRLGSAPE